MKNWVILKIYPKGFTIKVQYFEFHAIRVYRQGKGGWVRRGRRRKGMLVCFQESHFLVGIVEFSGHCVLCGSEIELGGGEFGYDVFKAIHVGLGAHLKCYSQCNKKKYQQDLCI